jgi:hypothetical protein
MLLGCAAAVAMSILVGWLAAPPTSTGVVQARSSPYVPKLERPGVMTLTSANGLLTDHPPPKPPPPKPPPKPPPPPPPPDVALVLAGQVSAVVADPRTGKLSLILQTRSPQRRTQVLKVGDQFMDGWRISELTRRYAVLKRLGEIRRVTFY